MALVDNGGYLFDEIVAFNGAITANRMPDGVLGTS